MERGAGVILEELCKGTMTCVRKRLRGHTPVVAVAEEVIQNMKRVFTVAVCEQRHEGLEKGE